MKPKIIDISLSLKEGIPAWPNSVGFHLTKTLGFEKGDSVNVSRLNMDVHTGTHIENSLHFIKQGDPIDKISLERFIGPATVVDLPKVKAITADVLERLALPKGVTRLLFKTRNSDFWHHGENKFQKDYVGLTSDAALRLSQYGIELVGNDYLSVAQYEESTKVHRILLKNKIIILEGLNLYGVAPGSYQLVCFPLKLVNAEAAPARAVLLTL